MNEILDFLIENKVDNIVTDKTIGDINLDMFMPDYNIAIQYHELNKIVSFSKSDDERSKNLFIKVTETCEANDIHVIHILDTEWNDMKMQELWKSTLLHKVNKTPRRIFARKCKIVPITSKQTRKFLDENHLQGGLPGAGIALAMNGELLSVGLFSKSRYRPKSENAYEILRFASKINTSVVGAFSKILKEFKFDHPKSKLISYANRRWSTGQVYKSTMFALEHETMPCYYYLDPKTRELKHRSIYQKHKLEKVLDIFDDKKTEVENMYNNGFSRYWDCGTLTYFINT